MGTDDKISGSVGRSGKNFAPDVMVVQRLLGASLGRYGPLRRVTPNGVCGPDTIEAITQFQRNVVRMPVPDGRVDPGGKTLLSLVQFASGRPVTAAGPAGSATATMDISQEGLKRIGVYEGLELKLYDDVAGYATIGYGHLVHKGRVGTNPGKEAPWVNGITETQALALLKKDASEHVAAVRAAVRVPLLQHQFDALVSLSFNIGANALKSSTLVRIINQGNATPDQIRAAFGMWIKAGGKVSKGLVNRRANEATVYNDGKYW